MPDSARDFSQLELPTQVARPQCTQIASGTVLVIEHASAKLIVSVGQTVWL